MGIQSFQLQVLGGGGGVVAAIDGFGDLGSQGLDLVELRIAALAGASGGGGGEFKGVVAFGDHVAVLPALVPSGEQGPDVELISGQKLWNQEEQTEPVAEDGSADVGEVGDVVGGAGEEEILGEEEEDEPEALDFVSAEEEEEIEDVTLDRGKRMRYAPVTALIAPLAPMHGAG